MMDIDYSPSPFSSQSTNHSSTTSLFIGSAEKPYSNQEANIKARLEHWRFMTVQKLGFSPDQIDYCCRNNVVMHDIFIEAIARSASKIKSLDDFENVAYYWHWVDKYGAEVYEIIRDQLEVTKRLARSHSPAAAPLKKRIRV